jgi:ribonuclease P protein component
MERLKRRTDFRAAAAGARAPASAFVLQARSRGESGPPRVGFTVSRQVGNAVQRNRVRRRLREVVRLAPAAALCAGHDYVLIGRRAALQAPFGDMVREFDAALRRIHDQARGGRDERDGRDGRGGTGAAKERSLHRAGSPSRPRRHREERAKPPNQPRHEPPQKH